MGGQQSTDSSEASNNLITIANDKEDHNTKKESGITYRISDKLLDDLQENTHEDTTTNTLNKIAAQTYDNIHQQLVDLQEKHIEKSKIISESIKSKLSPVPINNSICFDEKIVLANCLKEKNILDCDELVNSFVQCSNTSIEK
mmetsp:Transcript_3433/g.3046  ORF Transcript_3433/g.3046 Transcript_3433/m.3046 type:complete len:143 (-) Transcript_3433:42-470(-)